MTMSNDAAAVNHKEVHFQDANYNALVDHTNENTNTTKDPEALHVQADQIPTKDDNSNSNSNSNSNNNSNDVINSDYKQLDGPPTSSPLSLSLEQDVFQRDENIDVLSFASTVLTADGIADPTSFKLNCLIVFLGDMSRGIFFPTMWNLVQQLGGDQVTLGYVIASFSFGRMLVLPLFGSWSNKYGYKWTLQISTAILFVGTLLFAQVLNVGTAWYCVFANAVLGVGSGTLGVTMAYASEVTPKRKRTGYIAWVTAVQYAGTTATPFIGSFFVVMCTREKYYYEEYRGFPEINEFTAPALFMSFMSATSLLLLSKYFEDRQRTGTKEPPRKLSARQHATEEIANSTTCFGSLTVRTLCLVGCMAMNAFTKGPMSCFETLGIEFAESRFEMHRAEAGSIVATMGLLGALILMVMGVVCQRFDDTQMTIGGILLFVMGIFINTQLDQDGENAPWRYSLSMFLCYSIGYPICHTALVGLFSKIVGRRPQGTLQGWFSASGSVARISFPILAGYIVSDYDIETLFKILAVVLLISMSFLVTFRKTLATLAS